MDFLRRWLKQNSTGESFCMQQVNVGCELLREAFQVEREFPRRWKKGSENKGEFWKINKWWERHSQKPLDIQTKWPSFRSDFKWFWTKWHFIQKEKPMENQMPFENRIVLVNRTKGYNWNTEGVWYSSPHCNLYMNPHVRTFLFRNPHPIFFWKWTLHGACFY